MADNTTTYKAVIDVDTKGTDQLNKLNKSLDETLDGFEDIGAVIEKTRKALQKAKLDGDKVEFKRLRKELNQLQDDFETTEIQSLRFKDALAEQPGIVGLVGQSIKGLDGGMKVLAANPIIAIVSLLAGLFLALRESLKKTERGQELLNKASEAFGKILGPVFAIIESVAFPIFDALIGFLDIVAEGFNKFARFLGIGAKEIEEASRASSEVLQKAHEDEIARQEELTAKEEEERQKRIDAAKREAEEKQRILEQAAAIQKEAELSLLDDRTRTLKEREERFQKELAVLKAAGFTDFTALEGEYYKDLMKIRRDFDGEQKVAIVKSKTEEVNMLFDLEKRAAKDSEELSKMTAKTSIQITEMEQEAKLAIISDALGTLAQAVGEDTKAGKALAIAQAIINTYAGATKALATYPPPFGAIAAATVVAAGFLQVKAIRNTKVPEPPGMNVGRRGASSGGGGSISTPPTTSFAAPQIQTLPQSLRQNTGSQIAETIASAQKPVRAYVVSGDISSQQALDRRVTNAATFGG